MLKIVICDDEKTEQDKLRKLVAKFSLQKNVDIDVVCYSTGEELLNVPFHYDILFLDIRLNGKYDGIAIGQQLRRHNNKAIFILSTVAPDRYRDGYQAGVHRYLEKPISYEAFEEAMTSAIQVLHTAPLKIEISFGKDVRVIDVEEIIYIESYRRKRYVHLKNEKIPTLESLDKLEKRLPSYLFYRPQKSFLINFNHVVKTNKTELWMEGGRRISYVKGRYHDFNERMMEYLNGTYK